MIKARHKGEKIDWRKDVLSPRVSPATRLKRAASWHARVKKAQGKG